MDYPFAATPSDGTTSLVMIAKRCSKTVAPFGLGVVMLLLLPSEVAYEHLAELGMRAPFVDRSLKKAAGDSVEFSAAQPVVGSMRERFLDGDAFRPQTYYAGPVFDRSQKSD